MAGATLSGCPSMSLAKFNKICFVRGASTSIPPSASPHASPLTSAALLLPSPLAGGIRFTLVNRKSFGNFIPGRAASNPARTAS